MLISTMNDLPGYEVEEVFGEVFGLTVRSRNLGSQIGAGLKSIIGGELGGMTKMLAQGREEAIARLVQEAEAKGANAIIASGSTRPSSAPRGPRSARTGRLYGRGSPKPLLLLLLLLLGDLLGRLPEEHVDLRQRWLRAHRLRRSVRRRGRPLEANCPDGARRRRGTHHSRRRERNGAGVGTEARQQRVRAAASSAGEAQRS
jgi:uncharacterized protein YbjQ (UPF0145 family)